MFDQRRSITHPTTSGVGRPTRVHRRRVVRRVVVAAEGRGAWDAGTRAVEDSTPPPAHDLGGLRDAVEVVARAVTADESPGTDRDALRERVQLFDRLESLAAAGMAATLSALATTGGIDADGAGSTTEWVTANTRRSGRDAARLARLATDLPDLPATRAALADGTITPEAADAVVGAVRDGRLGGGQEVEDALLATATTTGPERLRSEIRRRQQRADADALLRDELEQHARRRASLVRRATGGWDLHARLTDEVGATLATALAAFDRPLAHARGGPAASGDASSRPESPRPTSSRDPRRHDQRTADALAAMVQAVLDHDAAPTDAGVSRPHLAVLVDLDTLARDPSGTSPEEHDGDDGAGPRPDEPGWAELAPGSFAWGGDLSPQAVRRLACDAVLSRVVLGADSQVLDVGRATRSWSEPQRRAVNVRDRQCRGPNCSRPIGWTNIHHVRWWGRDHGPTSVDNGLALCHHCHHLVHDRGWEVCLDPVTATATWRSPAGHTVVTRPPRRHLDADCRDRDSSHGDRQPSLLPGRRR